MTLENLKAVTLAANQYLDEMSRSQWKTAAHQTRANLRAAVPEVITSGTKDSIVTLLPRRIVTFLGDLKMH